MRHNHGGFAGLAGWLGSLLRLTGGGRETVTTGKLVRESFPIVIYSSFPLFVSVPASLSPAATLCPKNDRRSSTCHLFHLPRVGATPYPLK